MARRRWLPTLLLLPGLVAPAFGGDETRCAQIVALKDSSSGSTWFAQSLNAIPGVSIKLELLTSRDASASPTKQTGAVVNGLAPSCGSVKNRLTGFTLNPHHAAGVDWREVARRRPRAVAVVWDRTNVVKKAASGILADLCGSHNVRTVSKARKCRRTATTADPVDFLKKVRGEACDAAALRATAASLTANATVLTYEAFQRSGSAELERLFGALGLDAAAVGRAKKSRKRTVKRSPEDLRSNFRNFDALSEALRAASPGDCDLEAMLLDTGARPFPCDGAALCAHLRALEKGAPPA